MRLTSTILIAILFTVLSHAQTSAPSAGWIVDDFNAAEIGAKWTQSSGKWKLGGDGVMALGFEHSALVHSLSIMRTKKYTIEASLKGTGGGVLFCMEHQKSLANSHVVFFTGGGISTGYMDFAGKYVETRSVDYIMPSTYVRLRIVVDPIKKTYAVGVQDREVVLEELRFLSGFTGMYSKDGNTAFDYFQVAGDGQPDAPSFFLKSNERQLDHLAYMALLDDAIYISNPVVGMVQRLTSIGSYTAEVPVQGMNAEPRGLCLDEQRWLYVVDGGQNSLRVYNTESLLERVITGELKDPRGVAAVGGVVYVLDAEGIKVYDKNGTFSGAKATGLFKDPKNIFLHGNLLYVADFGNGQVQVLDRGDFSVKSVLKDNLVNPWDACVDAANGDVYVADPGASAVFRFDSKGAYAERIEPITIKGFISPRGVRVRGSMVYVADFERILGFKKGVLSIRPALKID